MLQFGEEARKTIKEILDENQRGHALESLDEDVSDDDDDDEENYDETGVSVYHFHELDSN